MGAENLAHTGIRSPDRPAKCYIDDAILANYIFHNNWISSMSFGVDILQRLNWGEVATAVVAVIEGGLAVSTDK